MLATHAPDVATHYWASWRCALPLQACMFRAAVRKATGRLLLQLRCVDAGDAASCIAAMQAAADTALLAGQTCGAIEALQQVSSSRCVLWAVFSCLTAQALCATECCASACSPWVQGQGPQTSVYGGVHPPPVMCLL